jgi:type 1 glutamine amidotransferase
MTCKKALLFYGGWDGHKPAEVAHRLQADLAPRGIDIDLSPTLDCLNQPETLQDYQLFIPNWTMGTLTDEQGKNFSERVSAGAGCAGLHGGAGDAFRGNLGYEWMIGGHFVGHPHVGDYTVRLTDRPSPITENLPTEIAYNSEQYYMMIDPVIEVLAEALYTHEGRRCIMPIAWTKMWNEGRVFYSALGHKPEEFDAYPEAYELTLRGITWAASLL